MKILKYLLITAFITTLINGCGDPCDDVDCGPNGVCVEGNCVCNDGYSGANCGVNVCDSVDCGPNGTCNTTTGDCACNPGYEGEFCDLEIRERYYGTYIGDMTGCPPDLVTSLIPAEQLEPLQEVPIVVGSSTEGINHINIGSSDSVLNLSIDVDISETEFTVPVFSQSIVIAGNSVEIQGSGTGTLVDEDSLTLSLDLTFIVPLFGQFETSCEVTFIKM